MIRTVWVGLVLAAATYFYGSIALVAALFGVRGRIYSDSTRKWGKAVLRASRTPVIVHGAEHVRPDRAQIIVSNHISGYDIFALASVVESRFAFVGKKELDSIPFFGRAWRAAGHISIDRSNRQKAIATLQEAGKRIRADNLTVIIFPEGTRSRSGELLPFKKGAFALAVEAGVPVVPTVISGSDRIMGKKRRRVTPGTIVVRFGEPIEVARDTAPTADALLAETRARMLPLVEARAPADHA